MAERVRRVVWMTVFAAAMGYLEAVVVVYLRRIHYPGDPLSLFPMKVLTSGDLLIEVGRETATVLMILAAAVLAERGWTRILASFAFIFGIWDLTYYLWLKAVLDWPVSWMEWDILFLIPWAWLGPWPAPAAVATVLAVWGGWIVLFRNECRFGPRASVLFAGGTLLILGAFLQPAFSLLSLGPEGLATFRPGVFWWPVYFVGLVAMTAGLVQAGREPKTG